MGCNLHLSRVITCVWILMTYGGQKVSSKFEDYIDYVDYDMNCQEARTLNENSGIYNFEELLPWTTDFCLYLHPYDDLSIDGLSITISFLDFVFGHNRGGNCSSYVQFGYDQIVFSTESRKRYCGNITSFSFTSSTGFAWIRLHRDPSYPWPGRLRIHYSAVSQCSGNTPIASYTFIASRVSLMKCEWSISLDKSAELDPNTPLEFHLLEWTAEPSELYSRGSATRLKVYDGKTGPMLASFDHNTSAETAINTIVFATGPMMYITFYSDENYPIVFNASVKAKGICLPGTSPCGDGVHCYENGQMCDGKVDCSTAYDELGCKGCSPSKFWCGEQQQGDSEQCFSSYERCNGEKTCRETYQDEAHCDTCGHGAVICANEKKCIFERWVCDGDIDCTDGSDEAGCSYPASRRVITAAIVGSLVCTLLLVISMGCTCKLYSLRTSHHRRNIHLTTPLTRVEREIFARQAPPTYDMTVSGVDHEAAELRLHRNRRRRNRRYPFRRTAPARTDRENSDNRQEGVQSVSTRPQQNQTRNEQNSASRTAQGASTNDNNTQQQRPRRSSTLQSLGSFLFESMRVAIPSSDSSARQSGQSNGGNRDNGTQSNRGNRNGTSRNSQSSSNANRSSSRNRNSSTRSSSRNRSSRGASSSGDQQAKPLPVKKRIQPVRVPAPCENAAVEEDMLACVYPSPPSYTQAVSADLPSDGGGSNENTNFGYDLEVSLTSSNDPEPESSTSNETTENLTTVTKSRFSFTLGKTIRKFAVSSFQKFRRNPYLQMRSQDSRRNSEQGSADAQSVAEGGLSFVLPGRHRNSTSSDDDMIDCADASPDLDYQRDPHPSVVVPPAVDESEVQSTLTGKIFPPRRNRNFVSTRNRDEDCDSINMLDLSCGEK